MLTVISSSPVSVTVISGTVGSAAFSVKPVSRMFRQLSMTKAVISPCVISRAPRPLRVTLRRPFIHSPICFVTSGFSFSEVVFETW